MLSSPSLPRSNTLIINLQSSSSFSTQNPYPEGSFTHTDRALFGGVPTSVKVKYPERNQIKIFFKTSAPSIIIVRDGNSTQKWKLRPSWNCYKRKKNAKKKLKKKEIEKKRKKS